MTYIDKCKLFAQHQLEIYFHFNLTVQKAFGSQNKSILPSDHSNVVHTLANICNVPLLLLHNFSKD